MGMIDYAVKSGEGYIPTVHLELNKESAKEVKKFRPGQVVKVMVVGTIESQSFRKPDDPEESGFEGSVCLKISSVDIAESKRNAMAELLDDDE
jgi:hypothetical protein